MVEDFGVEFGGGAEVGGQGLDGFVEGHLV